MVMKLHSKGVETVESQFLTETTAKLSTTPALKYYSFDRLLSFNAIFNFCIGARGLGKTYGAKVKVIKAAIRRGEQFIYLRRYKDELKVSAQTFFADIALEFPDYDFQVRGNKAEMAHVGTRDEKQRTWKHIGYFIALSTAQGQKSVAFPLVTTIIYDEFIIEKGLTHYLPNEATAFTNFYSTVDRYKDKTRVLFLANSVSITNPYFLEYDIKPDKVGEFIKKFPNDNGVPFLVCHVADSKEFSTGAYTTRFGQFIKGSEYADYAMGNQFADNNANLLGKKNAAARYFYSIETKTDTFSVWIDLDKSMYYIQADRPKQELLYTIVPEKMKEGKTLLLYNDKMVQILRTAFRTHNLLFDNARSRNAFIEIFKR